MNDTEASIKMAELAGYKAIPDEAEPNCVLFRNDTMSEWPKWSDWNPKENIAQAMEVLEAMNMDFAIWKSSGSIDPDTGYVMYEVTIGDSYVSLEDTLTEAIFNAVKKYLEEASK